MAEVTLKKLAAMLNLSIATVSRALKNHPDISDATKNKVKELAEVLEYEPNTYAVNLRTNHSREFGLIVPAISNDFYQSFISSMEEEARLSGYSLIILLSLDDPLIELQNLKRCKQSRMAGIFVSITSKTTNVSSFLKLDEEQHIPVIFFDLVPPFEACNKVCVDDAAAASIAAETLILRKKVRILAGFGNKQLSITQKRLVAFKDTFVKFSSDALIHYHHSNSSREAFTWFMETLNTPDRPDAIFCMSDDILIGAMKAIQTLHLRLPDDLGLIAISDGVVPHFYYPEITYIETSGYKLAKMAFSRMLACIAGSTYVRELKIEATLVEGGSI
jgi:LacI family transcriptional regulator